MADKKNKPNPFSGGMKPPSFAAPGPPGGPSKIPPKGHVPPGAFSSSPAQPQEDQRRPLPRKGAFVPGGSGYTDQLKLKIEQAKKTLEDSRFRKKEKFEQRELYWMSLLKEKEKEADTIKREMKEALENMEDSQTEKETALRGALQQFESRLMGVSRELDDEKKKSYRSMQKAKEESEASLKIEMALKEIVSSKDYEDKLENLQNARENLLKDMIRQKDNFNREKSALEDQIGTLNEQISNQRQIISRKESAEQIFEAQKEKDIESARAEAKARLEDLLRQVRGREESVRLKENEFRVQEFANKQQLDNMSGDLRKKESELSAARDTASRLARELTAARNALEEGNSKFVKEIDWLKKHFDEERAVWGGRFDKEGRLRKEAVSARTDIAKERDSIFRELARSRVKEEDLSSRLAGKEKDISDLKNSFEKEKNEIKGLYESGLERITSARDALTGELRASEISIKRLEGEKKEIEEELVSVRKAFAEKETRDKVLRAKIDELSSEKQGLENDAEERRLSFESVKKQLFLQIDQLKSEKAEMEKENFENKNMLDGFSGEISKKEREIEFARKSLHAKISEHALEKENLERKIKILEGEKSEVENACSEYSRAGKDLEEKLRIKTADEDSASSELNESKRIIGELNGRLSESKKELSGFMRREDDLKEKIADYERVIDELNKNITVMQEESEKSEAQKEHELEKAISEIEELNGKLNGFLKEKNKLSGKVDAISRELFDMTKQRDTLFKEKNIVSGELSSAKTQIEQLLVRAAENAAAIDETTEEISLLKDKLKNLSASHSVETVDLKNKILEQHKKMEKLFSRINEYNLEIEALKAAPRETVEEYKRKLIERQDAESKMREELEELRAEKERSAEKDGRIKDYDGKIELLEKKLSETESEMGKMREQSAAASGMDAQIVRKDAQLKEASGEIRDLRDRIESLEEEKSGIRKKIDTEIIDIKDEYNQRRAEIEERTKAFEKTKEELNELRSKFQNLSDANIALKEEAEEAALDSEKFKKFAADKEREIGGLKERLDLSREEITASYEDKIKKLSDVAAENGDKAKSFENQLKEAEKEIAHLKESSSSESQQADEFKEKLRELEAIIEKQKKDISAKMEYLKDKELEFHKILKKKDEDISVLKAQLEIGLEALGGKSGAGASAVSPGRSSDASPDKKLDELQKINEELKRKSAEREAMLREEIERKETEAAEYRNQISAAESKQPAEKAGAPSELKDEIKTRTMEAVRLKSEMTRARNYYEKLEGIIKKQDEKISRLQNKEDSGGVIKRHDIVSDDEGDIKF
ncbi:MAG: hypothetical protein U9O97_03815 [Elusimicrobiota bacterium]|nr:hypothetical protein [Elusimicrobiota bacterium]